MELEINIDPRECGLLVRWAIHHYGGIGPAIDRAEAVAAWLLASNEAYRERGETTAEFVPHFEEYVRRVRGLRHQGDCNVAASWLTAPITCSACVYEDAIVKAWEMLRIEAGAPDWRQ
jgi:hypothetical protein